MTAGISPILEKPALIERRYSKKRTLDRTGIRPFNMSH
jgi:hypothetical protein